MPKSRFREIILVPLELHCGDPNGVRYALCDDIITAIMPPFAPLLTPLYTHRLGLSIGGRQHRRNRRDGESRS